VEGVGGGGEAGGGGQGRGCIIIHKSMSKVKNKIVGRCVSGRGDRCHQPVERSHQRRRRQKPTLK